MSPFSDDFVLYPQHRVVICKPCQHAVIPQHIRGHLRSNHRGIEVEAQEEIIRVLQRIPNIAPNVQDATHSPPTSTAIPELPVYQDGFQCIAQVRGRQCQYVCEGKRYHIKRRCREQHGCTSQSSGAAMWVEDQACQQFSTRGQRGQYFVVQKTATVAPTNHGNALFAHIQRQIQQQREIQAEIPRSVANPWLEFTGWTVHLAGFTSAELLTTIMPAVGEEDPESEHVGDEEEDQEAVGLAEACHATRRLIRQAFRVCRPQVVGRAALEYVNRRECGAENNEKPFYGEKQVKTVRKYSGHWVKILRYIWRTHPREHRPQYALLEEQGKQLAHVQAMAVQVIENSHSGREQAKAKRQLVRRCLQFWLSMFDQPLKDCEFQSGIISGLAILGLDVQKEGWVPAVNITPILAGIITTLRAMVVYHAYGIRQGIIQHYTSIGKTLMEAQVAAPSVLEGVQPAVDRFMTLTRYGAQPMPLDRIFHQKTYGMKIRYTTKAPGQVLWEGERVTLGKAKFTVDHIRTVVHGLNESVRQRLKHELL
ncbi:hypothetical protein LTR49_028509 [Elasticomyces elasticus]|nr:hypothetical protein LTR49_028509 [Elasticomyces elasticus]